MRVGVTEILERMKPTWVVPAGLLAAVLMTAPPGLAAPAPAVPSNVALDTQGHGWRMTDSAGMSLYTFARDVKPGASNCLEECAMAWPPVSAPEDFAPGAGWSVVERPDGIRQLAYEDKPLYRNRVDQRPGDTYGEGVRAQWYLALIPRPTPPGVNIQKTLAGYVAADKGNKTLYAPVAITNPASLCVEQACSDAWQPLLAPWLANDLDRWSVVVREDGLRQWAFEGKPLFRYAGDVHPGEMSGEGQPLSEGGAVASTLLLQPRPPYPDWIMVHDTDAGEMLANLQGKTVYTYDPSRIPRSRYTGDRIPGSMMDCELDCLDAEWVPIFASAEDVAPGGNWAIVELSDGRRQWAYKGRRLFTNTRDKTQGSFLGYRHGGSRAWNVIMHSEEALVGTLRPP